MADNPHVHMTLFLHGRMALHQAGNILVGSDGSVRLGDMGVSATMERASSWGHAMVARMSLVGSPCWMAPEVLEQVWGEGGREGGGARMSLVGSPCWMVPEVLEQVGEGRMRGGQQRACSGGTVDKGRVGLY